MSSLISRQTAINTDNHCTSDGQSLGWGHTRTRGFTLAECFILDRLMHIYLPILPYLGIIIVKFIQKFFHPHTKGIVAIKNSNV